MRLRTSLILLTFLLALIASALAFDLLGQSTPIASAHHKKQSKKHHRRKRQGGEFDKSKTNPKGGTGSKDGDSGSKSDPPNTPAAPATPKYSANRPNFVFVLTDDMATPDISVMKKTKKFLGESGTTFENAYATEPLCCPARATLLTGQYSHNNGVLSNKPPYGSISAFQNRDNTIATWLHAADYRTGFIGKYLNGPSPRTGEPGWDFWASDYDDDLTGSTRYSMYDYRMLVQGQVINKGHERADYKTDFEGSLAQSFIQSSSRQRLQDQKPFALFLFDLAPHDDNALDPSLPNPLPAPEYLGKFASTEFKRGQAYNENNVTDKASWNQEAELSKKRTSNIDNKRRDRLESLLSVDDQIKMLVQTLQAEGTLENTVFIFSSDNGYLYGEHRLASKSRPYEESVRIPMIIRGPGFPAGATRTDMVAHHDITRTIVDMAEATPQRVLDGRDLRKNTNRRELLLECPACEPELDAGWQALRTTTDAFFSYNDGQTESYDMVQDPYQLNGRPELRTAALQARLQEISKCAGSTCP